MAWPEVSYEQSLLNKIRQTTSDQEREALVVELDALPAKEEPFYYFWTRIHETWQFEGWTDDGYDSSNVDLPRDVQLLSATEYGVSDIENGGLHQYFGNGTGIFAPEMIEWFDRAGMSDSAEILRQAVSRFGPNYPRSQDERGRFLDSFEGNSREEWDPFYELDDQFYATLSPDAEAWRSRFNEMADRWLHETCGIRRLADPPRAAKLK